MDACGLALDMGGRWAAFVAPCDVSRVRRVAKGLVEFHGSLRESAHHGGTDFVAFVQRYRRHLVFSAGLQAPIDLPQALPPPEAEQDALRFGADEEHGTFREIDEVAPLD